MDWNNQSKFTKWFIIILIAVNIITITMMWIFLTRERKVPPFEGINNPRGSIGIMQKELNLSNDQISDFEKLRIENFDKSKELMAKIDDLKQKLSVELVEENKDTVKINFITNEIGLLFSDMEKLRFNHFEKLIALCTPEQKEKLEPILQNIIARNPQLERKDGGPGFRNNDKPREPMPMNGRGTKPF